MEKVIEVKDLNKVYPIYDNPMTMLVDALGLSRQYRGKDFYALSGVNFSVEKGETLGIIGENGAGKSTLLKILTGVLNKSSGEVNIKGKISALLELGTGFNPEYTGIENIYLSGNINGLSREEVEKMVPEIEAFADIGDFINQKVKTYSSGMFARLAFAVAVHVNPEILIVDEALSVGDMFFQQKCNLFMKDKMKDKTILLVTHDMASIASMADKVLVLSHGKQVFYGEPLEAIEYYTKMTHSSLYNKSEEEKEQFKAELQNQIEEDIVELKSESKSADDWIEISQDELGGALEANIEAFKVQVNGKNYAGYVTGNDVVKIQIMISSTKDIGNLIVGYQIKDRYGNPIFGENTHSSGMVEHGIGKGEKQIATIEFKWPEIHKNCFFLTLGLGEGDSAMSHVIQCWAHNIFQFNSISSLPDHGIFNVKLSSFDMRQIGK